jgi:hypothetical protein
MVGLVWPFLKKQQNEKTNRSKIKMVFLLYIVRYTVCAKKLATVERRLEIQYLLPNLEKLQQNLLCSVIGIEYANDKTPRNGTNANSSEFAFSGGFLAG